MNPPLSLSDRQRLYRAKRAGTHSQLNLLVPKQTAEDLRRLAAAHDRTQAQEIEHLVAAAVAALPEQPEGTDK